MGITAKLAAMAGLIGAVAVICVVVAAVGLTSSRTKSHTSQTTFNVFRAERDAYEGWLTDDDQSNMLSALAALGDRAQLSLMHTTGQQAV